MKILIVDDDPQYLRLLQTTIARFGHEVTSAANGYEALTLLRTGAYHMLVSDWEMPDMDGLELCRQIRHRHTSSYIYIILLTVRGGTQNIVDGLEAGADEFLTKPFDPEELRVRIQTGRRILALDNREVTISSLAKVAESRDQETGAHIDRIQEYCRVLAEHLSQQEKHCAEVDGDFVRLVYLTSPLHDIGKVGIPDQILLKSGSLNEEEAEVMKQHTVAGSMTLDSAIYDHPEAKFLCIARDIARSHHERFDGTGYPDGLAGNKIPLCARIVALADVYDALTTQRSYKPPFRHEHAKKIILRKSGTHFDPDIVQAFLANEARFVAIYEQYAAREERESRVLQPQPAEPPSARHNSAACRHGQSI